MKLPFEWFKKLVGHEEAPRTEIAGMPFRAVGEGPPAPPIEGDEPHLEPLQDGKEIDFEY